MRALFKHHAVAVNGASVKFKVMHNGRVTSAVMRSDDQARVTHRISRVGVVTRLSPSVPRHEPAREDT